MRTRTSPENTILSAAQKAVTAVKVEIKNAAGTYVDWFSRLLSVTWGASIDAPIAEVRLTLARDSGQTASLSPFRGDSSLNTGGAAIDAGRDIKISPATSAWGVAPVSGDYKLLFQGKTADIDPASTQLEVIGRDLGGFLVTRQIKEESQVRDTTGIALETVIQDLLDDWAPGITLYVPTSPGFLVTSIDWGKGSLFDAIRTAAGSIGWDIRYLWDNGTSAFRLTLFEPDRAKTTPDWTFAKDRYININTLKISADDVRNYIVVSFFNSVTNDRDSVFATDGISVARFQEQWMEITEADTSPINTTAEAQALADAALADLAWPIAETQVEMPFFWPVDLNDLIRFTANDIHSDEDLDLAVVAYEHQLGDNRARTVLTCRGKPAGFYRDWIRRGQLRAVDVQTAHPPIPGTSGARAQVNVALELNPVTHDLNMRVTRMAPGTTAGFGWWHQLTAGPPPAFTDSTLVFFDASDPEDEVVVALPDLAADATAWVTVWPFDFPPSSAPAGSVGLVGIKQTLNINGSGQQLTFSIKQNRRYPFRFDVYVTISDPANLPGQLEVWTQNSIFLGEQPELRGFRFSGSAATDIIQVRDIGNNITPHVFENDQLIRVHADTGALPTGVAPYIDYFAIVGVGDQAAGVLRLSTTVGGGSPVNLLSDGTGAIDGAPNATIPIPSTPITVGPNDSLYLGNLIANSVDTISLQFRFTNTAGASLGRKRLRVPPMAVTLDGFGQLGSAAPVVDDLDDPSGPLITVGGVKSNAKTSGGNIFPPDFTAKQGGAHPAVTEGYDYGSAAGYGLSPFWGKPMSCGADVDHLVMGAMVRLRCIFEGGTPTPFDSDIWEVFDVDGAGATGYRNTRTGVENKNPGGTKLRLTIDNMIMPVNSVRASLYLSVVYTPIPFTISLSFPSLTAGAAARDIAMDPTGDFVSSVAANVTGSALVLAQQAAYIAGVQSGIAYQQVVSAPVYTKDMTQEIVDTVLEHIHIAIIDNNAQLLSIGQATVDDGLFGRPVVKGYLPGTAQGGAVSGSSYVDGATIIFPVVFQSVPAIIFTMNGVIVMEWRRSKWTGPLNPGLPVRFQFQAKNKSAGGFTPVLRLIQPATSFTARDDNFGANTLDVIAETASVNLANAPSSDDLYNVRVRIVLHTEDYEPSPSFVQPGRAFISFSIDVDDGGGFVSRLTVDRPLEGLGTLDYDVTETFPIDVAGLIVNDDVRISIIDIQLVGPLSTAHVVATDVQYQTSASAPVYASLTPDQATDISARGEWHGISVNV